MDTKKAFPSWSKRVLAGALCFVAYAIALEKGVDYLACGGHCEEDWLGQLAACAAAVVFAAVVLDVLWRRQTRLGMVVTFIAAYAVSGASLLLVGAVSVNSAIGDRGMHRAEIVFLTLATLAWSVGWLAAIHITRVDPPQGFAGKMNAYAVALINSAIPALPFVTLAVPQIQADDYDPSSPGLVAAYFVFALVVPVITFLLVRRSRFSLDRVAVFLCLAAYSILVCWSVWGVAPDVGV